VRVWDVSAAKVLSLLRLDAAIQALSWGPDAMAIGERTSVVLLDVLRH